MQTCIAEEMTKLTVDLAGCYFSFCSGTDKENSDKETARENEEQSSSSESECEESDNESGDEAAQTQSDAEEADVGLRSLLEDPSGEQQSENKVSYQSSLHEVFYFRCTLCG